MRKRPISPYFFLSLALLISPRVSAERGAALDAVSNARQKRLADQREWHLLLHFHYDVLGRYRSEIDDKNFFLSPHGRRDPAAELDATLAAFYAPPPADPQIQHPQCRFPARYAWLKEQMSLPGLSDQPCPRFEQWRQQMDAESISLIFASYYLNNPASMYGHTFLRLNAKGHRANERLLDYTVNFAAFPDTTNGFLFAVEGLTGQYRGRFSTMPYYLKVQEYNNLESRDLWEYQLQLSAEEVQRLVRHLWEMGQASMAYFFLNKNCSYQLLPLLEVARPSLHLVRPFWFKAIPADTLRQVIRQPGMLAAKSLRPSHVSHMLRARDSLEAGEITAAEHLAARADDRALKTIEGWPADRQARVLDSAFDLFRYRAGFSRQQPQKVVEQERRLLLARNRVSREEGRGSFLPAAHSPQAAHSPDEGHPTGRIGFAYGFSNHSQFEELSLRPALHDLNDRPEGYIPGSELEMFYFTGRFDNRRHRFYVQDFTLINLMSLSAWDSWVRKPSWHVRTGIGAAQDLPNRPEHSLVYRLEGGPGFSAQTHLWRQELLYALLRAEGSAGQALRHDHRVGGGPTAGAAVELARWWRSQFEAAYLDYFLGDDRSALRLRSVNAFTLDTFGQVRCTLERNNRHKEILVSVLHYF